MDATAHFATLVQQPHPPLDRCALAIAAHAHPELDVDAALAELDGLAAGVEPRDLHGLRRRLYVEAGFAGNTVDYYDPRNSYVDAVLERRTGIPITLAVVAMEVGRRAGVPLVGVGMPGHFLARLADDDAIFLDPFDGVILDRAGCRTLFARVVGDAAAFLPEHLAPVSEITIIRRMLANLKAVFERRRDAANLVWVLRLRLALPGAAPAERLELSRALSAAGRYGEAAEELEVLAVDTDGADDALLREARRLRARLN